MKMGLFVIKICLCGVGFYILLHQDKQNDNY